jgi:hypothetical protein
MALHFLVKTQISLDNCVKFADGLALEHHEALRDLLRERVGGQAAALFAEPLLSRGNDAAPPSVSWYSDIEAKARPLSSLPASARGAVETYLSDTLAPLRGLLDDPDAGPLVGAALWQLEPTDIMVVGGRAVLVNWGMRPAYLGADASALSSHYAATIGRYLPLSSAPSLGSASGRAGQAAVAAATVAAADVVAAGANAATPREPATSGSTAAASTAPSQLLGPETIAPVAAQAGLPVIAWLPLTVLLLLATLILAWLILPGTRLFPVADTVPAVSSKDALNLAQDVNRDLHARRDALQAALEGAVCRTDGTLVVPGGRTPDGLLPPALLPPGSLLAPRDRPGDPVEAVPDSIIPPNPARVTVPVPDTTTGELATTSLLQVLESRTVLVLALGGGEVANGTGFVVGPGLIVTNEHVISDAARMGGQIMVVHNALPGPQPATILATHGPLEERGGDYALLRIADTSLPSFQLHRSLGSLTLTNVVAAGFPGDVLETDTQFTALLQGDLSAVPSLSVTDGSIITEQALAEGTNVLVHSAPLSNGNSGGPLVDYCGRVVGVNTFVRRGDLRTLNFALASQDLLTFLNGTPAATSVVEEACRPQVMRPEPAMESAAPDEVQADEAKTAEPNGPGAADGVDPANSEQQSK